MKTQRLLVVLLTLTLGTLIALPVDAHAVGKKPNILVIWGDDIGYWNVSAYNQGMMGYSTPSIDSIASDGAPFNP